MTEVPVLLYSRRRAADALSISVRSLDYLIKRRKLTTQRIGRKVMIPHGELVRFARGDHPEPMTGEGKAT
jgi:hypothetical protein